MNHICYPLRTEPVTTVPADPLDCPLCRNVLLEAFRPPAETPDPASVPVHLTNTYLFTPPGHTPSWTASCSCGWSRAGLVDWSSPSDETLRLDQARMLAEAWAARHRKDPGGTP